MKYSVDIARDIHSLACCIQRVNNGIEDNWDWRVTINAGDIDDGIYFNFDTERKHFEISNQPDMCADDSLCLDEILKEINSAEEEDE